MRKLLKNANLLQIALSIALIIFSLSAAYYFVYYLPSREKEEQTRIQTQERSESEIYSDCEQEAREKASKLLKDKVEILEKSNQTYRQEYKLWKEASEKDLLLKDDYNEYFDSCIRKHGLK